MIVAAPSIAQPVSEMSATLFVSFRRVRFFRERALSGMESLAFCQTPRTYRIHDPYKIRPQ
jgi:hypothetical protein